MLLNKELSNRVNLNAHKFVNLFACQFVNL